MPRWRFLRSAFRKWKPRNNARLKKLSFHRSRGVVEVVAPRDFSLYMRVRFVYLPQANHANIFALNILIFTLCVGTHAVACVTLQRPRHQDKIKNPSTTSNSSARKRRAAEACGEKLMATGTCAGRATSALQKIICRKGLRASWIWLDTIVKRLPLWKSGHEMSATISLGCRS